MMIDDTDNDNGSNGHDLNDDDYVTHYEDSYSETHMVILIKKNNDYAYYCEVVADHENDNADDDADIADDDYGGEDGDEDLVEERMITIFIMTMFLITVTMKRCFRW